MKSQPRYLIVGNGYRTPPFLNVPPPHFNIYAISPIPLSANPVPIYICHSIYIFQTYPSIFPIPPISPFISTILHIPNSNHIILDGRSLRNTFKNSSLVWNHQLPLNAISHVNILGNQK